MHFGALSANATVAEIDLSGGSLTVAAAGNRVLRTATLYVEGSSKLNLIDNSLILDYAGGSPPGAAYANVAGLLTCKKVRYNATPQCLC